MAKSNEFYKGTSRRRRSRILIPAAVLVFIIAVLVVLFYGMQKYAVITKDDVKVRPAILGETPEVEAGDTGITLELETVDVDIDFDEPDYNAVERIADGVVQPIRAIFVAQENLNVEDLTAYASRLVTGNALVIEMKPRSGVIQWYSQSEIALAYGLSGTLPEDVEKKLKELHDDRGVWLAAQIAICRDELYASRSTVVTLRNAATGGNYIDDGGSWLDAYNLELRQYTIDMITELYAMGFDEVILSDVAHPVLPTDENQPEVTLAYTRDMSTHPSAVHAVCGFAVSIAQEFKDRPDEKVLSIYVDSKKALVGTDTANGQSAPMLFKLYDRVYFRTDRYEYNFNIDDVTSYVGPGAVVDRFVPVVYNYLPDNPGQISWVLVDLEN